MSFRFRNRGMLMVLTVEEEKVLRRIWESPSTIAELEGETRLRRRVVMRALKALAEAGFVAPEADYTMGERLVWRPVFDEEGLRLRYVREILTGLQKFDEEQLVSVIKGRPTLLEKILEQVTG